MIHRDAIVERARTNWRNITAIGVIAVAAAVALYFAPTNETRQLDRTIERRGTPCVEQHDGSPSPGCERLFFLLLRECAEHPKVCGRAARRALRSQPRLLSMDVLESVGQLPGGEPRAGRRTASSTPAPLSGATPPSSVPPRRGKPGKLGPRGDTGPPGNDPSPRPGVSEQLRDGANDALEELGLGRPVPPLPASPLFR